MNDQNFNLNQFFVLAAFLLIYPSSLFAQAVELKDKQEIEIALTLQSKIRQISAIVESCMRTGEKRLKACQCDAQKYISDLKELYNSALNTHPTWADKTLNVISGPHTSLVNLHAIKLLVETAPCD